MERVFVKTGQGLI